jgi:hypothetical protein
MSSKNGLVSLVSHLGDEKIKIQNIHNAIEGTITLNKKGDETKFTMVTESSNLQPGDFLTGKKRKIGIVLWIDPEDYEDWRQKTS